MEVRNRRKVIKDFFKVAFGSDVINVQDSEARDLLANERTFLAWTRTGFAVCAVGVVIARLTIGTTQISGVGKILSLFYILLGLLATFIGLFRHTQVQHYLLQKKYPLSGITVTLFTLCGWAIFIFTFVFLLIS